MNRIVALCHSFIQQNVYIKYQIHVVYVEI